MKNATLLSNEFLDFTKKYHGIIGMGEMQTLAKFLLELTPSSSKDFEVIEQHLIDICIEQIKKQINSEIRFPNEYKPSFIIYDEHGPQSYDIDGLFINEGNEIEISQEIADEEFLVSCCSLKEVRLILDAIEKTNNDLF